MMQMTVLAMMFIPKRKKSEDNKKKYETKHIRMCCSTCWNYAELADKSNPVYIGCGEEKL